MYRVLVGNIGNVCTTQNHNEAKATYNEYVTQSKTGYGRAAYENVTLFRDAEIIREHTGTTED